MSIVVRFQPAGLTREQHDRVTQRLEAGGNWPAPGLQVHVTFGDDGNLLVSEIWESEDQMRAFGETLMPILQDEGVQMAAEPQVFAVHDLVRA